MSLSKSKHLYTNNCLHLLKRAVPLYPSLNFAGKEISLHHAPLRKVTVLTNILPTVTNALAYWCKENGYCTGLTSNYHTRMKLRFLQRIS